MDPIARLKAEREAEDAQIRASALAAWSQMMDDDRAVVRFGMIPKWAADMHTPEDIPEAGRRFSVALMDIAKASGAKCAY